MIIRLKVNGFKDLVDVDVRFGPFSFSLMKSAKKMERKDKIL